MQADSEIALVGGNSTQNVYISKVGGIPDTMIQTEEPMTDDPSSPESSFDATDLMQHVHGDGISARTLSDRLSHSGPAGVAAAAAITSFKKTRKPHAFETNPAIRKRQQTRLLRKIRACIEEYTVRVGQQAAFLAVTPHKGRDSNQGYKVFGSQPLENVLRACRNVVMQELETTLASQAPAPAENSHLFELPQLLMDGMPTPLEKMTQAHLRAFIPEMLKYSTGRSKPGWGKQEFRPTWWPSDVPWENIRCDVRSEMQKKQMSWTTALRAIIRNCYKHHGREDLLPMLDDVAPTVPSPYVMQTINNPDGTLALIQIDTSGSQLAENSEIITLGDGTQAAVVRTLPCDDLEEIHGQHIGGTVTEATLSADGTITLPDGSTISHSDGMVQLPVSMYNGTIMVGGIDHEANSITMSQPKSESNHIPPPSTHTVEIS